MIKKTKFEFGTGGGKSGLIAENLTLSLALSGTAGGDIRVGGGWDYWS